MGLIGKCVSCGAVLVALFAILIGLFFAGVPAQLGLGKYMDEKLDPEGRAQAKGLLPFMHHGTPWGFNFDQMPSQAGKTFLVTGANVGLGWWTSFHLASKGGHVVMGCRSEGKCTSAMAKIKESVPKASLEVLIIDLQSFASIKVAAAEFKGKHSSLHSLILNAGIMMTPFGLTKDGIEQQLGTNHFGHFVLTRELQDTLTATATAANPTTIVAVSSAAHFDSYPEGMKGSLAEINDESAYKNDKAYGQSKLANVLFAQELAERLAGQHVLVNSIHPGIVQTDLFRHITDAIEGALPSLLAGPIVNFIDVTFSTVAWSPEQASLTQLYTAVGPELLSGGITGKYFHPIARETPPDLHAQNTKLQKAFWKLSEEVVALIEAKA